jgi:anti-sigma factor RsiW
MRSEMNCGYVRDNLSFYMDKEADESLACSIEAHLQACDACRDYYEGLRRVSAALDAWEEAEPPPFLKRAIVEQVRAKGRISLMNALLAAAAALVIAVSVFVIYGENGSRDVRTNRSSFARVVESGDSGHAGRGAGESDVSENEIIANLEMFQERDFYDSMDAMKELDYLPLVDDAGARHDSEKRSSLEFMTT